MHLIKTIFAISFILSSLHATDNATSTSTSRLDSLPQDIFNQVYSYVSLNDLHQLRQTTPRVNVQVTTHETSSYFHTQPLVIHLEKEVSPEGGYENSYGLGREPRLAEMNIVVSNDTRGFKKTFYNKINGQSYDVSFLELQPVALKWFPLPIKIQVNRVYRNDAYLYPNGQIVGYTATSKNHLNEDILSNVGAIRLWGSGKIEYLFTPTEFTHPIRLSFCDEDKYVSTELNTRIGSQTLPQNVVVRLTMPNIFWSATLRFEYTPKNRIVPITLNNQPVTLDENGDFHMTFPVSDIINMLIIDEKKGYKGTYLELQQSVYRVDLDLKNIEAIRFSHDKGIQSKRIQTA
ncbi:MAG: hypothetical protein KF820_06465 [Candidatus Paracaedibacteraceae bacterium]|nr:hypothetical protein [Candidatus Paracaedibacteraceae bacterium]